MRFVAWNPEAALVQRSEIGTAEMRALVAGAREELRRARLVLRHTAPGEVEVAERVARQHRPEVAATGVENERTRGVFACPLPRRMHRRQVGASEAEPPAARPIERGDRARRVLRRVGAAA